MCSALHRDNTHPTFECWFWFLSPSVGCSTRSKLSFPHFSPLDFEDWTYVPSYYIEINTSHGHLRAPSNLMRGREHRYHARDITLGQLHAHCCLYLIVLSQSNQQEIFFSLHSLGSVKRHLHSYGVAYSLFFYTINSYLFAATPSLHCSINYNPITPNS